MLDNLIDLELEIEKQKEQMRDLECALEILDEKTEKLCKENSVEKSKFEELFFQEYKEEEFTPQVIDDFLVNAFNYIELFEQDSSEIFNNIKNS